VESEEWEGENRAEGRGGYLYKAFTERLLLLEKTGDLFFAISKFEFQITEPIP
jgi:hypothetical protein